MRTLHAASYGDFVHAPMLSLHELKMCQCDAEDFLQDMLNVVETYNKVCRRVQPIAISTSDWVRHAEATACYACGAMPLGNSHLTTWLQSKSQHLEKQRQRCARTRRSKPEGQTVRQTQSARRCAGFRGGARHAGLGSRRSIPEKLFPQGSLPSSKWRYRGAASTRCNTRMVNPPFVLCLFHNLQGFDGHLLTQVFREPRAASRVHT